ncbi:ATP-binding cassette domain-containing protein [Lacticaseibacillus rhamnosus]|uniref:ATP-binding cassette domain-containing protein n=1 Tax=Lacticaseibacillus rhamnosus TaxID=47715 RepID=UPI000532EE7F|nr:ATP-binding cassette domain-containing protein [Lacticaseibacillus rhamnosus]KMO48133.1 ABC transporter [Lacticaseibacillus rhamnosus]OAU05509.1 ABC transporter [Lacticaseibacillus rhamnosus]
MNKPVVELHEVSKRIKKHVILNNINLEIEANKITTIYGASGSGKSTLLNIIGLLDKPTSGHVKIFDHPAPRAGSIAARKLLNKKISYLFQNFALINDQSIKKNLALAKVNAKESWNDFNQRKKALLKTFNITTPETTEVGSLSGGEQQRIALARCLLKPCDLILCDEPTGSLDPANKASIFAELEYAKAIGKTILIVSHDPYIIARSDTKFDLAAIQS